MTLFQISPDGICEEIILGQNILKGEKLQHVVPAGYWFAGLPNIDSNFSFLGCTVSPGFEYRDFELGSFEYLVKKFPQHESVLKQLPLKTPS